MLLFADVCMTISAILLCIGLFALRFPVFIDDYDQWVAVRQDRID